uniref:Uncharacterized protein n=1 Tax=Romanomermis culicivorax TaxID=13658 RepID=A0A915IFQ1_ROMCU
MGSPRPDPTKAQPPMKGLGLAWTGMKKDRAWRGRPGSTWSSGGVRNQWIKQWSSDKKTIKKVVTFFTILSIKTAVVEFPCNIETTCEPDTWSTIIVADAFKNQCCKNLIIHNYNDLSIFGDRDKRVDRALLNSAELNKQHGAYETRAVLIEISDVTMRAND